MNDDKEQLLTPEEVAERLRVSKKWVYNQARARTLPSIKLGRYVRFERQAIDAWIERQKS